MTSFTPIAPTVNLRTSLLGVADPVKFVDPIRPESQVREVGLFENYDPSGKIVSGSHKLKYTIIIILVSAIIFVTAVSIYDVIRHLINNHYAKQVLLDIQVRDPENVTDEDRKSIERTLAANQGTLMGSLVFAVFCVLTAILLIPLLLMFLQ